MSRTMSFPKDILCKRFIRGSSTSLRNTLMYMLGETSEQSPLMKHGPLLKRRPKSLSLERVTDQGLHLPDRVYMSWITTRPFLHRLRLWLRDLTDLNKVYRRPNVCVNSAGYLTSLARVLGGLCILATRMWLTWVISQDPKITLQ